MICGVSYLCTWWPIVAKCVVGIKRWMIPCVLNYIRYSTMKYFVSLFVLVGTFICASCLYEDQIGKFDW